MVVHYSVYYTPQLHNMWHPTSYLQARVESGDTGEFPNDDNRV